MSHLENRTLLATVTWINPTGGDWDTPANWSSGTLPGPSDTAVIAVSGITVTHSSSASDSVNSLTISSSDSTLDCSNGSLGIVATSSIFGNLSMEGGTLTTAGTLTVSGDITWLGGTVSGPGILSAEAGLTIVADLANEFLVGVTLENAGTATLSSTGNSLGYGLVLESGAVLDNRPGANLTLMPNASISGDGTTRFMNEGTLAVSPQVTSFARIQSNFTQTSTGSTTIDGGLLLLQGGGTMSGSISVALGAVLEFDAPLAYELDSASTISGGGLIAAVGTVVTVDGTYDFAGETQVTQGGSLTFNSDATINDLGTALSIYYPTSTLTIGSSQPFSVATMHVEGTLSGGGGDLTVTDSMTWIGGTIANLTTLSIPSQATLIMGHQSDPQIETLLSGTLANNGSATLFSGGSDLGNGLVLESGATFDNQPEANFTLLPNAGITGVGTTRFINEGALAVPPQVTSFARIQSVFTQTSTGSTTLDGGHLLLQGGGTISGSISVTSGTVLEFDAPLTYELDSASSVSGAGLIAAVGTVVTEDGAYDFAGETQVTQGGSLIFNNDATITDLGTDLSIYYPTSTLTIESSQSFSFVTMHIEGMLIGGAGDLTVTGTMTWQGGMIEGFRTLSIPDAASLTLGDQSGADSEVLHGVSLKTAGSVTLAGQYGHGEGGLSLEDGASVDNRPNGIFTIVNSAQITTDGSATVFSNEGTLVHDPSDGGMSTVTVPLVNTGSVNVRQGTLNLSTATNSGIVTVASGASLGANGYAQTAGSTVLNGGSLNGGTFNINAGALTGSGTINGNVINSGQAIPGGTSAAGLLRINGDYTQTSTGSVNIELGGTGAGAIDHLTVSGTASLDGSLNITLINNFQPAVANAFQLLSFASSSGNFTSHNSPSLGGGLFLDPVFNASSLTMVTDRVAISGVPTISGTGIPFTVTGSVTGPSSGSAFAFSWIVTRDGNPFGSGTGSPFSFTPSVNGTYVVNLAVTSAGGGMGTTSVQVVVGPSIFVLNSSASGALTISGNASINVPGEVVVDSNSSSAISASGNVHVTASVIDVQGGFKKSGNATFSPAPATGVSAPDPFASLASPSTTGLTLHGALSLSGNSRATIQPGIYSQITVSGNASLTLEAGIYILEGGGFTVSANASVSGSGVMIYNAGSNYPNSGGNFGGITLSGNDTFKLAAPATGTYAGILIFQSRQNTRAMAFSGNAMLGMTGTIYAASALLSMSGNAQLQNPLVVDMLNLSGNVGLTQTAAGSDTTGDTSLLANTLLAGDLSVYVNDSNGKFSADELGRIQDAINAWDGILAPCNVTITEVSDPSLANVVIDTGTTSAAGGADSGVLGCYDGATGEITLIQNWSWYAGADPSQIGAGQYDFETTVTHELGHALGLGHSADPNSPMYETLAVGIANRIPSRQDLNIPDPPDGADPQIAAGFSLGTPDSSLSRIAFAPVPGAGPGRGPGPVGLMPLPVAGIMGASFLTGFAPRLNPLEGSAAPVNQPVFIAQTALRLSLAVQELDKERGDRLLPSTGIVPDSDLDELATSALVARAQTVAGPVAVGTVSAAGANRSQATQGSSPLEDFRTTPVLYGDMPRQEANPKSVASEPRLTDLLLAAGFCSFGAGSLAVRSQQSRGLHEKQKALKINPRRT